MKFDFFKFTWLSFKLSLLMVLLSSMYAWMFWNINIIFIGGFCSFLLLLVIIQRKNMISFNNSKTIPLILLIIMQLYTVKDFNLFASMGVLLSTSPIFFIILLNDNKKIELLNFITSVFSYILAVSIIFWLIFLIGIPLSYKYISFNNLQYEYNNYYFFLYNLNDFNQILPRFSSIFLEPGHLGIITTFLLYVNKFNLRNYKVVIILISTIISFSLAAYVLLLLSVTTYLIIKRFKNLSLIYVIGWFLILVLVYNFFIYFNDGENAVNKLIIERLQFDNGDIVGNNRFSKFMDSYFENFTKGDDFYLGIGSQKYALMDFGANAGYKVFLVQYGLIGLIILTLFYFSLIRKYNNQYVVVFLIIIALSFIQRSYALWNIQLFIFITGVPLLITPINSIKK